jgi:hypothetical protein
MPRSPQEMKAAMIAGLASPAEVDGELVSWLKAAYDES